jgi:hypothetical protein
MSTSTAGLLTAAADVVIRFKGHGSYGTPGKALKALRRRMPGAPRADLQEAFDLLASVYDRAVDAVRRHQVVRSHDVHRFSAFEDIDFDACMAELDELEPGVAAREKSDVLSWVILWHYLK